MTDQGSNDTIHEPLQARAKVLERADEIIELLQNVALDPSVGLCKTQQDAIDKIYPTINALIVKAQEKNALNVENTSQVLDLVKKGKVSIDEAMSLVALINSVNNPEDAILDAKARNLVINVKND